MAGFGDQRGIGCDAVQKAGCGKVFNLVQIGGINEELHVRISCLA
jgi:hypothetical protein